LTDDVFVRIPLRAERHGLLSRPGWLATHAAPNRTSPTLRGLAIRSRIFCQEVAAPAGLAFDPVRPGDADASTRQRYEEHARNPVCAGCHRLMDPIGFGFENMDAIGRSRLYEEAHLIDSQGMLSQTDVDGPFVGPAQLGGRIATSAQVNACLVTQLFRFVEGRDETQDDACALAPLQKRAAAGTMRLADILIELVTRDSFAWRKVEP
jgi:hypothetical protein